MINSTNNKEETPQICKNLCMINATAGRLLSWIHLESMQKWDRLAEKITKETGNGL